MTATTKSSEFPTTDRRQVQHKVAVLLPRLSGWVKQLVPGQRYSALETFFARATTHAALADSLDQLRLKLFGYAAGHEAPVAALGRLANGSLAANDPAYYLRLDPVIMQADMSRVMLVRSGFADFPVDYQAQVRQVVQEVLAAENLDLQEDDAGYWTVALPDDPGVTFISLDDALGADISECLPEGAGGQRWKKLHNEIQMALHACSANQQRRQRGEAVINSVWFWGGGCLPKAVGKPEFDRVYSVDPVTSGLARLWDISLQDLQGLPPQGSAEAWNKGRESAASILVDWAVPPTAGQRAEPVTPERLEQFLNVLLGHIKASGGTIELHSPEQSWCLHKRELWRFWKKRQPLAQQLKFLQAQP